jgi:hypothetical protein
MGVLVGNALSVGFDGRRFFWFVGERIVFIGEAATEG